MATAMGLQNDIDKMTERYNPLLRELHSALFEIVHSSDLLALQFLRYAVAEVFKLAGDEADKVAASKNIERNSLIC